MPFSLKKRKVKPEFKLWFRIGDDYVFGEGAWALLNQIQQTRSISAAAKATRMSYRYAWSIIKKVEEGLGEPVLKTQRGGRSGGKSELTQIGYLLLNRYSELKQTLSNICKLD